MSRPRDWSGRRVLLTGAASGIGRCLARALGAAGAQLALVDRDAAGLHAVQAEVQAAGGVAHTLLTDLCDPAQAAGVVARALVPLGRLDVLINNAGLLSFTPLDDESPADIDRLYRVNVVAPVLLCRAALPHFKRQGSGHIVNVGSIFGSIGFAWFATYSSSKFAIRGFSEALRRELAGTGIAVSYVAPRATRTALAATFGAMAKAVKMKLDEPERVAGRILDAVERRAADRYLGFPECVFVRLNALLPRLVDRAVARQDAVAEAFAREAAGHARPARAPLPPSAADLPRTLTPATPEESACTP